MAAPLSFHSSVSHSQSSIAASIIDQLESGSTPTAKTKTKAERRVTVGVVETGKFRLSKDVRV